MYQTLSVAIFITRNIDNYGLCQSDLIGEHIKIGDNTSQYLLAEVYKCQSYTCSGVSP